MSLIILGEREQPEPLITWKAAADRVPWGIVFLLGSGFCVANACQVCVLLYGYLGPYS